MPAVLGIEEGEKMLLQYAKDTLGVEISFVRWMAFGLPLVACFLPIAWWLLTRVLYPLGDRQFLGIPG